MPGRMVRGAVASRLKVRFVRMKDVTGLRDGGAFNKTATYCPKTPERAVTNNQLDRWEVCT